jgi:ABC-type multidrug transport system fused ATPase/permease subunit
MYDNNSMIKSRKIDGIFELFNVFPKRLKAKIIGLLMLMMVSSLMDVISISALIPFLTALLGGKGILSQVDLINNKFLSIISFGSTVILLGEIFILAIIIASLMRVALFYYQAKISNTIGRFLGGTIFSKILNWNYEKQVTIESSNIISLSSTKISGVVFNSVLPTLTILHAIILVIIFFLGISFYSFKMALLILVTISFLYAFIAFYVNKRLAKSSNNIDKLQSEIVKLVQETLGGIRDVIMDGSKKFHLDKYIQLDDDLRKSVTFVMLVGNLPKFIIEALVMIILVMLIIYQIEFNKIETTNLLPALGALVYAFQRLLPVFQQAYSGWSLISGNQVALRSILELVTDDKKLKIESDCLASGSKGITFNESITLDDISYRYPNAKFAVIDNLNLIIKKGSHIGIVGKTGAGKSTLLDIIMGLLKPSNGFILVDGIHLDELALVKSWQKIISHVPQSIFLYNCTIEENIALNYIGESIDAEKVIASSKLACIHDEIQLMPYGYKTLVGERGRMLSGGQAQRLGIARALYKGAEVLILDEATSAIDDDTEQFILKAIEQMVANKITVISVTHKQVIIKTCDLVYEIQSGKLIKPS